MQKTDLTNFSSFLVRSGLEKGITYVWMWSLGGSLLQSFTSKVFRLFIGVQGMPLRDVLMSLDKGKNIHCGLQVCVLRVYNCVHCVQLYTSVQFCTILVLFWSYFCGPILLKNFSFPWSHLLCVTYNFQSLQKCFMWTIDNPNQMQTMFWESMNVSELLKKIFEKISGKSLQFCRFFWNFPKA